MSEQTPGHTSDMDGLDALEAGEPSMEDILASIRKIIADDVDPVPLAGPGEVAAQDDGLVEPSLPIESVAMTANAELPETGLSATELETSDDLGSEVLDIDALLGDLTPVELEPLDLNAPEDFASDATDPMDAVADLAIPDIPDAPSVDAAAPLATALGASAAKGLLADPSDITGSRVAEVAATSDDDMDGLMDELLADLDMVEDGPDTDLSLDPASAPTAEPAAVSAPEADLDDIIDLGGLDLVDASETVDLPVAEDAASASVPQIEDSEDLELVKSLMEDLTDEDQPAEGLVELSDDLAEASQPSEGELPDDPELMEGDETNDVLDEILNMTLDDEIEAQPLDIPEPDAIADTPAMAETVAETAIETDAGPSLSDIAASADADADAAHSLAPAVVASAAVAGAALAGGAVQQAEPVALAPVAEPAAKPVQSEATPNTTSTPVETPMPRAIRSDAILDEVTEEATMSAFAELNTVVEEKAVYSERGPRIGDLVSEALKPMLKEWLDANLKGIVERAVAKEVKRISTGK